MRKLYFILILVFVNLFSVCSAKKMKINGPGYLPSQNLLFGQKPPGLTPEVFAPGIVSINNRFEGGISFSPELDEMYFGANDENEETLIYFSKLKDNKWTPIKRANFTGGGKNEEMHPFVSPDGKRIYFTALDTSFSDEKIWYINRSESGWSDAIQLDSPLNDDLVFYPNQAKNGSLYYFNLSQMKTYHAPNKNGRFTEAHEVKLELGHHAFIAPSEDYLLVTARNHEDESRKDNDIYVYFKQHDGTWGKPINLGSTINSNFDEKSPSITSDGQYLFFGRSERDTEPGLANIYWVSTEVINQLRPVANEDEFPIFKGPYLGQKPPGLVAEPFAPGIISKDGWELEGVFAPGMKEFYYTTRSGKDSPINVIGFRQKNNIWKQFTKFKRQGEVTFSPDGQRMHMADGYKERMGDGWSERKSLGPMFDREDWGIMRLTASAKSTYVFDDYKSDDVIRISTLKNGKRQPPKTMGPEVNTGKWTAHPFIAPDESYLIWDSEREGGYGDSDLYISFRQENGSWGEAINMGDKVNSDKWDAYASVTPDGKYILFNRRIDDGINNDNMNVDIYWVDAQIIETLRPNL